MRIPEILVVVYTTDIWDINKIKLSTGTEPCVAYQDVCPLIIILKVRCLWNCLIYHGNSYNGYVISLFWNVPLSPITTRTTKTPAFWGYPPPPHDYPYHWVILDPKSKEDKVKVTNFKNSPKFQIFEFWNGHYMRHTFWSCLIRCANMKWIRWVLLKIQSGHDSVHRRTRWNQYTPLSTWLKRGV